MRRLLAAVALLTVACLPPHHSVEGKTCERDEDCGTPVRCSVGLCRAPGPSFYADAIRRTPGLLAYWRFEEQQPGDAVDELGGFPGTYIGSPTVFQDGAPIGSGNHAALFDQDNTYLLIPSTGVRTQPEFTAELWIRMIATRPPLGGRPILMRQGATLSTRELFVGYVNTNDNPEVSFSLKDSSYVYLQAPTAPSFNDWHLLDVVWRYPGALGFYVDGVSVGQLALGAEPVAGDDLWKFGNATPAGMSALYDELALYNRALSSDEISSHLQAAQIAQSAPGP